MYVHNISPYLFCKIHERRPVECFWCVFTRGVATYMDGISFIWHHLCTPMYSRSELYATPVASAGRGSMDPELISLLRDSMLHMPSQLPYALKEPEVLDPSIGQAQQILEILGNKVGTVKTPYFGPGA